MSSGNKPIAIDGEPSKSEVKRGTGPREIDRSMEKDPDYPPTWLEKDVPTLVQQGYKYYKHIKPDGKTYMVLRHKRRDRGIGAWSEELEGKLFHFFPNIGIMGSITPASWEPNQGGVPIPANTRGAQHSFLGMGVNRVATIPREYVPTLNVVRYFQILKEEGFEGDFSQFINDIVNTHFEKCRGVHLRIVLEDEIQVVREEEHVENDTTVG